jgi:ferric-dicitrate binding protein FerR (iron transport regulator)
MSDERDAQWAAFDAVGIEEMRKRLGAHQYGEQRERLAREWLAHQESLRVSAESAASLVEARSANELARAANELAERANASALEANSVAEISAASAARSVAVARTNNILATAALIAAIIAIVVSVIGLKRTHENVGAPKMETRTYENK